MFKGKKQKVNIKNGFKIQLLVWMPIFKEKIFKFIKYKKSILFKAWFKITSSRILWKKSNSKL